MQDGLVIEMLMAMLPNPAWLFAWYLVGAIIEYHLELFKCEKEWEDFSPFFKGMFWPIVFVAWLFSIVIKLPMFVFGKYNMFLLSVKHKKKY
jgi:hypothetical protein